jgi:hypothetical protein
MGKFEKYANKKLKFRIDDTDLEIDFRVRDRIELASIHEVKKQEDQYVRLIEFCTKLLKRSYPNEPEGEFDGFLTTNMEKFLEEIMVGANLATRDMFKRKEAGEFRKEADKGGVPAEANAKPE